MIDDDMYGIIPRTRFRAPSLTDHVEADASSCGMSDEPSEFDHDSGAVAYRNDIGDRSNGVPVTCEQFDDVEW